MQNNSRKRNISTLIILAIVLLVPGFLYIALNKVGSNEYLKLPIYGDKQLSGKMVRKMGRLMADTTFHTIKPLELLSSDSSQYDFLGQDSVVVVAHLFSYKEDGLSKTLLENLKPIAERFKNISKVKLVSINVDSTVTVQDLAKIANTYTKGFENNWKVIGTNENILHYITENLLLDALYENRKYVFSNNYILIDSERRIRGFYDINMKSEIDRMEDEIKVQLVEEARNNPLKIEKK